MVSILGTMSKLQRILHRQKEPGCPPGPTKSQCVEAHWGGGAVNPEDRQGTETSKVTGPGQADLRSHLRPLPIPPLLVTLT